MAEPHFAATAEEDLPRTLRREKEARQREALGRSMDGPAYRAPETPVFDVEPRAPHADEGVTVALLKIPFFELMLFFIKAVFAAIPALFLLGVLLWVAGDVLMAYFPELVKMQIIFKIPN
jgi:hypothetical protein